MLSEQLLYVLMKTARTSKAVSPGVPWHLRFPILTNFLTRRHHDFTWLEQIPALTSQNLVRAKPLKQNWESAWWVVIEEENKKKAKESRPLSSESFISAALKSLLFVFQADSQAISIVILLFDSYMPLYTRDGNITQRALQMPWLACLTFLWRRKGLSLGLEMTLSWWTACLGLTSLQLGMVANDCHQHVGGGRRTRLYLASSKVAWDI